MKDLILSIKEKLTYLDEFSLVRPEGEIQFKGARNDVDQLEKVIDHLSEMPPENTIVFDGATFEQLFKKFQESQDLILDEIQAINTNFTGKVTPVEPPPDTPPA